MNFLSDFPLSPQPLEQQGILHFYFLWNHFHMLFLYYFSITEMRRRISLTHCTHLTFCKRCFFKFIFRLFLFTHVIFRVLKLVSIMTVSQPRSIHSELIRRSHILIGWSFVLTVLFWVSWSSTKVKTSPKYFRIHRDILIFTSMPRELLLIESQISNSSFVLQHIFRFWPFNIISPSFRILIEISRPTTEKWCLRYFCWSWSGRLTMLVRSSGRIVKFICGSKVHGQSWCIKFT